MATNIIDCYVKLPSGKTVTLDLIPSDTVSKACSKIAEDVGVPADRVNLKYQGKFLQKQHSMGYLGVCKETILKAEILQVKQLNLFVKLQSGKTIPVNIENISPVRYIKDAVHTKEGIPTRQQLLKISGRKLENGNQRCVDAGILDESILTLEVDESKTKSSSLKHTKPKKGFSGSHTSVCADSDDEDGIKSDRQKNKDDDIDMDTRESVLGTFDAMGKNVEVAFCFDTTGSMYSCLTQVRNKLKETVKKLIQEISNIRIAIMAQGDYCDFTNYVVKYEDFTNDVDTLVEFVSNVEKTGGGDSPECYEWSLRKAQQLDWSEDSAKAFVLIGDDVPHPSSYTDQNINWHEELDVLKAQGVKVYGVRAQHNSHSTPFYQEISECTGGAYIEFKNFAVITEMFLAVCYKQAGDEQFEQFCEEVAQNTEEGANKQEVQDILKQIDQSEKNPENKPKRYVAADWWDILLDVNGSFKYTYNANQDRWSPYFGPSGTKICDKIVEKSPDGCVHGPASEAPITRPVSLGLENPIPVSDDWKSKVSRTFSLRKSRSSTTSKSRSTDKNGCMIM